MNLLGKIMFNIGMSLLTEPMLRKLLANGLEEIIKRTENTIDNSLIGPVIEELRK